MKTALITGGSGAIGSMTAYLAVRQGWRVVFGYCRNETAARHLIEDLEKLGGRVSAVRGDLRRPEDRAALLEEALAGGGTLDLLVNNCGAAHYRPFAEETLAEEQAVLELNLLVHMEMARLALPAFLRQKSGAIVNVSSVWGQTGGSCEVSYSAAKAGLIGFTKALAKELAPSGVTVNAVAPGIVESAMLADLDRGALRAQVPTGKLCTGLDIAKVILFLAEQEQITGQVLAPNGGLYM